MSEKELYTWWAKYMFWALSHGFPWGVGTKTQKILIVGHRGSSEKYPENTMLAFRQAIAEGAHGIETDVRKTADNTFVLMHDATLNRTTNGSGSVSASSWSYVSSLDAGGWKGQEFANRDDTKVPTLEEFLDEFRGQPVFLLLQSKTNYANALEIADIVASKGMTHQCFLFADRSYIGQLKQERPNCMVMNDGTSHMASDLIHQAIQEKWDAISTGYNYITENDTNKASEYGIYVQCSTVTGNYQNRVTSLLDRGVDFILGDNCEAMRIAVGDRAVQLTPAGFTRRLTTDFIDGHYPHSTNDSLVIRGDRPLTRSLVFEVVPHTEYIIRKNEPSSHLVVASYAELVNGQPVVRILRLSGETSPTTVTFNVGSGKYLVVYVSDIGEEPEVVVLGQLPQ